MNFLVYIYIYVYIYVLVFSVCLILFHFILFLSNFSLFGRVVFFLCLVSTLFVAGIHFQWVKNSKGKQFSTGAVGKLTMIKWNPHMKSNTIMRETLVHICP